MQNIHPTADIHPSAVIIGPVTIGPHTIIGPGCVIGSAPEIRGFAGPGAGVYIGAGTILTKKVVVDAGSKSATTIWNDCYIMSGVHIGHDAVIKDHCTISPKAVVAGHCTVWDYANMGIASAMHQFTHLPPGAMLGAQAFMTKKCEAKPFTIYIGNGLRLRDNVKAMSALTDSEIKHLIRTWEEKQR